MGISRTKSRSSSYDRVAASWRAQESRTVVKETSIEQKTATNKYENE